MCSTVDDDDYSVSTHLMPNGDPIPVTNASKVLTLNEGSGPMFILGFTSHKGKSLFMGRSNVDTLVALPTIVGALAFHTLSDAVKIREQVPNCSVYTMSCGYILPQEQVNVPETCHSPWDLELTSPPPLLSHHEPLKPSSESRSSLYTTNNNHKQQDTNQEFSPVTYSSDEIKLIHPEWTWV
jgi:hypothetical protein